MRLGVFIMPYLLANYAVEDALSAVANSDCERQVLLDEKRQIILDDFRPLASTWFKDSISVFYTIAFPLHIEKLTIVN